MVLPTRSARWSSTDTPHQTETSSNPSSIIGLNRHLYIMKVIISKLQPTGSSVIAPNPKLFFSLK